MLAREELFTMANKHYAGGVAGFENLTISSKPQMADLRLIVLGLKKLLVKPRSSGHYHVIAGPDFYYDMLSDPIVMAYMTINQTTKNFYDHAAAVLPPMFDLEFEETMVAPVSSLFYKTVDGTTKVAKRLYRESSTAGTYEYASQVDDRTSSGDGTYFKTVSDWVKDSRTGQDASYIPNQTVFDLDKYNETYQGEGNPWAEFKVAHVLIIGKDALIRTGLAGEGNTKVYTKAKGSAGVIDPIDNSLTMVDKFSAVQYSRQLRCAA